ncbi:phosphocarrier protein [Dethiosulfatibacter aminovorans DSM 17477]|uniref:Phosphocarrier protein HPr n=1 Tax=Dethiosulfatibacter aminovorans DSM 17477 TaxID=1121476 RepID=A0A1M6GZF9_9FIRM|nr:HPr family phosphocarrier protein [Dethiosulfatibacter aminovorans]SHJ15322.1 phosphocarrier protein [Dethiosulfatibacter aminovorans DSM 17477]
MKFNIKIQFDDGLHARPASDLVKLCNGFASKSFVTCKGKTKNMKSIIEIMSLGLSKGDVMEIEVVGEDEAEATRSIRGFFKENDDE